jgi:cytochrome c-type biogenesis protein CcmH/NrfF
VTARRAAWFGALIVLVGALAIGAQGSGKPETPARRAMRLAADFRCPSCRDLSAAQSDASTAKTLRAEILQLVQDGRTDGEIRSEIVSRFGSDILLKPPSDGVGGLVWAVPVVAFVLAVAGLAFAFVRWRTAGTRGPTDDDRRMVEEALR